MANTINEFRGEHRFLSNFHPSIITVRIGRLFIAPTAEHVFQAIKTRDPREQQTVIEQSTPGRAKRAGRTVTLRDDWEDIKLDVMRLVVRAKFAQNPDLASKLLATGDAWLIEGNRWGDRFWGADLATGKGNNHLGIILMEQRDALREGGTNGQHT